MNKQTIEINNLLPDAVAQAITELKELIRDWYVANPTTSGLCLSNDIDYEGRFAEMIDSNVPIYTYDIKCAWFLHDTELEDAYDNAGLGENPRENNGMAAIHCYIKQECDAWLNDNDDRIQAQWDEFRDVWDVFNGVWDGGITTVSESEYYTKCVNSIKELND